MVREWAVSGSPIRNPGGSVRAFGVAWRSIVSFYNELYLLVGISLLWWVTGGIFVALSGAAAWILIQAGGVWWFSPLIAIPAGPASAALAYLTRQVVRDLAADRAYYLEGLRRYWKLALGVSAASMGILSLLILNIQFYSAQPQIAFRLFTVFWLWLGIFWFGIQLFIYPVLVGLKEPGFLATVRTASFLAFASPLFTVILLAIAGALTALSVVFAILVLLAWPAMMALLGEQSLLLIMQRLNPSGDGDSANKG
jgi:hypothetical protein